MVKVIFAALLVSYFSLFAQSPIQTQLQREVQHFFASPKAKVAHLSFYVADENGNTLFDYHGEKGLTTASTQKIFTAAAAMELLSPTYTYSTNVGFSGAIIGTELHGDLIIQGSGDPTLGSGRYPNTNAEDFLRSITQKLKEKKITTLQGDIFIQDDIFDIQTIPGGWAWNDIGNYYGAGVFGVNWRENQFEVKTWGKTVTETSLSIDNISWRNELITGGTSDKSIIFTAPFSHFAYINGQLPAEQKMSVFGAHPNPPLQLGIELKNHLIRNGISLQGSIKTATLNGPPSLQSTAPNITMLLEWKSPTMQEIVYWFLKKSINLYGETILKTIAKEKTGNSQYSVGVDLLKKHWMSKGIKEEMINFADASGLSVKNYVTAKAEVMALLYSQKQPWFDAYFDGFPIQKNGMKMKSGTMKHIKSYAGIHQSKSGKKYYFAIIMNNYQHNDLNTPLFQMLSPLKN